MQRQIASYLFQHKHCHLPGLGTLSVVQETAVSDFGNKMIHAPKPVISFIADEGDASEFINYLAETGHQSVEEASTALQDFCDRFKKQIEETSEARLEQVARFSIDASGNLLFKGEALDPVFFQPVFAERVIHPKAEHQMLVGDRETTNTAMTELLNPAETEKDRWWIWAIVLGVLALLMFIIYFTELKGTGSFGNGIKI